MARLETEEEEDLTNRSKIKCKFGFFVLTELSWTSKRVVVEFRDVQTRKVFRGVFDSLEMPTGDVLFDALGTQDTIVDTTVTPLELGPAIEDALKNKRMKFRYALRGFWLSVELETSMLPSLVDKVSHSTRQGTHFVDLFLSFRPMNFMDMIQLQMSDFEGSLESMHNLQELMNEKLALCFDRVNQLSEETDTFKMLIEKYVARLRSLEGHYYGPSGPGSGPGSRGPAAGGGSGTGGSGRGSGPAAGAKGAGHRKTQSAMPRGKQTAPGISRQASASSVTSVTSLTNVPSGQRASAMTTAGASKSTAGGSGGSGHSSSTSSSSVSSAKRGSSSSTTTGSSATKGGSSSRSMGGSRTPAPRGSSGSRSSKPPTSKV